MENSYRSEPGKAPGRMRVVCPVEKKDGKTRWVSAGAAFINKDQSINIYLDVLPTNGRLQVREWDDPPWERQGGERGRASLGAASERAVARPYEIEAGASGDLPF